MKRQREIYAACVIQKAWSRYLERNRAAGEHLVASVAARTRSKRRPAVDPANAGDGRAFDKLRREHYGPPVKDDTPHWLARLSGSRTSST